MKENVNKADLKREIAELHFMLEDLQLYLNTHPNDNNALAMRNNYVRRYKMVKEEYDGCIGMLNQDDSLSRYPWNWIEEPWPWEYEANFKL